MMTDDEIRTQVFAIVAAHARCDVATLTRDTTFDDLRMGSLDVVQILFAIEDRFDIYVPTEKQHLRSATLGVVCDEVQQVVAARHG